MPGVGGKTRPFFSLKHNSSGNTSGHSYKEKEILTIFPLKKPCTHTEHKKLFYNLYTSRIKCKLRTCILYTWTNPRTVCVCVCGYVGICVRGYRWVCVGVGVRVGVGVWVCVCVRVRGIMIY